MEALKFSSFTWPNNPETFRMTFLRDYAVTADSDGSWTATQGSRLGREITCEGFFYGEDAHANFSTLASMFLQATIGNLVHPLWDIVRVFMGELEVLEEPKENLIHYRILFIELPY